MSTAIAVERSEFLDILHPNNKTSRGMNIILNLFWVFVSVSIFTILTRKTVIPNPWEILLALKTITVKQELLVHLGKSFWLFAVSSIIALTISLGLAYSSVIPLMRPLVGIISKCRYLSFFGFTLIFMMMSMGVWSFKVSLLNFGMVAYLVTSYAEMVRSIKKKDFDYARTLRMTEWQVVWHVVIRGQVHQVIELFRQNAAMIWMMLTMVEGYQMDAGGVGAMLQKQYKAMTYDGIFAVQGTIWTVGLFIDLSLRIMVAKLCPYAVKTEEGG